MKRLIVFCMAFVVIVATSAQTYIPITNNMVIPGNSDIKFAAGDYLFSDTPADGVIQVNGVHNVILDGDSCRVGGVGKVGYMIKISNASNIVVRNFDSVFGYKYAVHIMNSANITINGNKFCWNKVDSSGWIDVWANYTQALGGGVMIYQSRAVDIFDNTMTMQNDGVALYHCDRINIHNNDFSWNTSFGIRMFWTDTCHIYQNNCSHVNRPLTDPSDCAAILLIISNENRVENNDLSWSGDGVFLGQYQHSDVPNNNYFAYNECSYSPHNAIEATFADGNVYRHNKCNYSHYGLWLGYSFNSVVDSNEIIGNYQSGLAIDRGFNNVISNNLIKNNPIGIELWEGSPVSGYSGFHSKDYPIFSNTFDGNTKAVSSINTKHALITGNDFNYSQSASIFLDGSSTTDTLTGNMFRMPTGYHIYNNSVYTKFAADNSFMPSDTTMISAKIFDKHDNTAKGEVMWEPSIPGSPTPLQVFPPCDMAEPGSLWYAYPEVGYPAKMKIPDSVYFDSTLKKTGAASVKLVTSRGYDLALNYRPGGDSLSWWALSDFDTLYFWVRTIKQPVYGFQFFSVRIGDDHGNYFKYTASPNLLNAANLVWKQYKFPLSGNTQFVRSTTGTMSLSQANYIEIHADTWDYGFTLWADGVQFNPCSPVTSVEPMDSPSGNTLMNYPNPFSGTTTISFHLAIAGQVKLEVYDSKGILVQTLIKQDLRQGDHEIEWMPSPTLLSGGGLYLLKLTTGSGILCRKMLMIN